MQFKRMNTSHTQSGFTLVETLVAITVLLLIVIGPMTVAQKGIQNAYFANEQVTATFLAQEAIEAIRVIRDDYALDVLDGQYGDGGETSDWVGEIPPACTTSNNGCAYDADDEEFASCASNNNCILRFDENNGRYSHSAGLDSIYERKVYVDDNPAGAPDGTVEVRVVVSWHAKIFGSGDREYEVQTWLYDHYQAYGN